MACLSIRVLPLKAADARLEKRLWLEIALKNRAIYGVLKI